MSFLFVPRRSRLTLTVLLLQIFAVLDGSEPLAQVVRLAWDASPNGASGGYYVYRSDKSGSGYERLQDSPISGTSYVDRTLLCGRPYYYAVKAVGSTGVESGFSNEAEVLISCSIFPSSLSGLGPGFDSTFVGIALANAASSANSVRIASRQLGDSIDLAESTDISLPLGGQKAFVTWELGLQTGPTRSLNAQAQSGPIQAFFMVGDVAETRLDGIGGELRTANDLYIPLAKWGEESTLLYLFNPSVRLADQVRLSLFDTAGFLRKETSLVLAPAQTIAERLETFFGPSPGPSDGYIRISSPVGLQSFALSSSSSGLAVVAARPVESSGTLHSPHFFADGRGGDTELRVLNPSSQALDLILTAELDALGDVRIATLSVGAGQLLVTKLGDFLGLRPLPLDQSVSGHLKIRPASGSAHNAMGLLTYLGPQGRYISSVPLETDARSNVRYLHVAQSPVHGYYTGLAILNPGSSIADVWIRAYSPNGILSASRRLEISPGERVVDLLDGARFFGSSFSQVGGRFEVSSSRPVITLSLFGDYKMEFLSAIAGQNLVRFD